MSPFIGSFTGARSFGRGGGADLGVWLSTNSFSLISGSAGSPTAVYERAFTSVGSYTISAPPLPVSAQVLVVGGGGSSSSGIAGGGGAGGVVYHGSFSFSGSQSVVVGNGGTPAENGYFASYGTNGDNSQFGSLIAIGGGRGGVWSTENGQPGGSGGGCNAHWGGYYAGGPSNQPSYPGASIYGNRGGNKNETFYYVGGGGGGAGGSGGAYGGSGVTLLGRSIGGGGGGGSHYGWGYYPPSYGGSGGGGSGTQWFYTNGTPGTANTGGGGGSGHHSPNTPAGNGGTGLVVVRVRGDGLTI